MFFNKEDKKLHTVITIKYSDKSGIHEEEFKAYALFGKWFCRNYKKVKSIIYIRVKGTY